MPLTPEEVAGKVFGPTRMRRGYDEHEVDAFLDEVEAELTRLTTENEQLRRDLEKARRGGSVSADEAPAIPAVVEPVPVPVPAPVVAAAAPPVATEEVAVEQRVTRMIVLAQQTADAALREAQVEADQTRGTARSEAERMLVDARNRVAEELGGLERSKRELEAEVEQLTSFEREYRQRLKVFLEGRLRDLDQALAGAPAVGSQGRSALDAGLADPPGFGAVWSPEEGGHTGGEPAANGGEEGRGGSPFDTSAEGSNTGGVG
jgi:DivIVA domain-containing protein